MGSRRAENCGGLRSCSSWRDGKAFLGRVHRYTARGSPPLGRRRGGGDAGSLLPGVVPPELVASYARAWSDTPCRQSFVPHTPHTAHATHHTHHTHTTRTTRTSHTPHTPHAPRTHTTHTSPTHHPNTHTHTPTFPHTHAPHPPRTTHHPPSPHHTQHHLFTVHYHASSVLPSVGHGLVDLKATSAENIEDR